MRNSTSQRHSTIDHPSLAVRDHPGFDVPIPRRNTRPLRIGPTAVGSLVAQPSASRQEAQVAHGPPSIPLQLSCVR